MVIYAEKSNGEDDGMDPEFEIKMIKLSAEAKITQEELLRPLMEVIVGMLKRGGDTMKTTFTTPEGKEYNAILEINPRKDSRGTNSTGESKPAVEYMSKKEVKQ